MILNATVQLTNINGLSFYITGIFRFYILFRFPFIDNVFDNTDLKIKTKRQRHFGTWYKFPE
jgi:hypothetical protein